MDITPIIEGLNEQQRQAVTSKKDYQFVLAGAGSGKTLVLIRRMAWIIDVLGDAPDSIMMVTFTNKAARELLYRVEAMLTSRHTGFWIGTFHKLSLRFLRAHWKEAQLIEDFQIIDSSDQLRVLKRIIRELDIDEKRWKPSAVQWFINAQKNEGIRPEYVDGSNSYWRQCGEIYSAYQQDCDRMGMVDFGEILLRCHELWLHNPDLLERYQKQFRHLLVDEFQDTNRIQYAWLRMLAGSKNSVVVVGDDDQSIYGWRGARIENIFEFEKNFSDTECIRLEQNYRSTAKILAAANAVISKNQQRLGKTLWTQNGEGELLDVYEAVDEYDEAQFIANYMQLWKDGQAEQADSWNYSDMAVLYRSNAQSRVLEEAMKSTGINYRIYGGQRFYERFEIKTVLAYMRLLVNPDDDSAISRIINVPPRGIGPRSLEQLNGIARQHEYSLWQAIQLALEQQLLAKRILSSLKDFSLLIEALQEDKADLKLHQLVAKVLEQTKLDLYFDPEHFDRGEARRDNLKEFLSACQAYRPADNNQSTLRQFLEEVSLDVGDNQAEGEGDAVQMMTLHSAKGLEFPLVVICGVEKNLLPHIMSVESGALEEERRLCYVGITRSRVKLLLTYARTRYLNGRTSMNQPSDFLKDIPNELIHRVAWKHRSNSRFSRMSETVQTGEGVSLGQRVLHPDFGNGTVTRLEGSGEHLRVEVGFDYGESKWLIYAYARLQPL